MKTILVPVDFSAATTRVCRAGCDLARRMRAKVVLLHVVPYPPALFSELYGLEVSPVEDLLAAAADAAKRQLQQIARGCARRGVAVRTAQAIGFPVKESLARAGRAAAIVLGSQGHSAMFDLIVGS